MTEIDCEAVEIGDRMVCPRCNQDWPGDFWAREPLVCKQRPDPPIGIAEMAQACRLAALQWIEQAQLAVKCGVRMAPSKVTLRRAAVIRAAARTLERVKADDVIMQRLRGG